MDLLLVLSVEPGFGGQSFQPATMEKARRPLYAHMTLMPHFPSL